VSKGCVIYMRVSTVPQASGTGLARQLEDCTRYANEKAMPVYGVFCDVGSGDGPMPNRTIAYSEAARRKCRILVESRDRWSRKPPGSDPLPDDLLVITAQHAREFEQKIGKMIGEYLKQKILEGDACRW
jgi:DNA invertase Pin-like site-specific DNA recombinase